MSEPRDWADELADTVVQDVLDMRKPHELVAARLRLLKTQGVGEGINKARDIINATVPAASHLVDDAGSGP